MSGKSDWICKN